MSLSIRRWLLLISIALGVIVLDQLSKTLILNTLAVYESVPIFAPFLQLTHSTNEGAAFGIGAGASEVFLVIAILVVIAMLVFYPRIEGRMFVLRLALGLIVGGALGNATDRLLHGHVIDFIHYQIPGILSNVSNIADHAIVFGVLLVFYDSWFGASAQQARERAEARKLQNEAAPPAESPLPPAELPHHEQHNSP